MTEMPVILQAVLRIKGRASRSVIQDLDSNGKYL